MANKPRLERLQLCLFFCRCGVFIVFFAWTVNKLLRPEHGVSIMANHYLIGGVSEGMVFAFGVIELVVCFVFVLGYYKRLTRSFFLFISLLSVMTPRVIGGYYKVFFVQAEPMIFLFSGFCLLACAFTVYYLRDYDTLYSLGK